MLSKVSVGLLLMAGLFFSAITMAMPAKNDEAGSLINERLSYMKDVAGYKANNHLAIEDLPQEAKVLKSAVVQAEQLGLDGESVKPFIQAQMDVAKAIQYRYRADWLSVPLQDWQPEPLEQVRSKISVLSTAILSSVSSKLKTGSQFTDKAAFMSEFNQEHLKNSDKELLWDSLRSITLKN